MKRLGVVLALWSTLGGGVVRGSAPDGAFVVDALGDTLRTGTRPERIVSLSPNLTETLLGIGVSPDRIVGVTRFCDFPPEALRLPRIGGIIDPSLEAIQLARPDLVLATRGNPLETIERLRDLGIPVFAFDDRTGMRGVSELVATLASLVGPDRSAPGPAPAERFRSVLAAYEAWSDSIPDAARPVVYFADAENPGWSAGPGSHVDDIIDLAGGRNLLRTRQAWPQVSVEAVLAGDPDVVLLAFPSAWTAEEALARFREEPGVASLRALREGRVCAVTSATLMRPGLRAAGALERLARCLHPSRPQPVGNGPGER